MNGATVRQLVRSKIADRTLPRNRIGSVSATYGAGQACDACSASVPPERILYELARAGSPGLLFHRACFAIWRDERDRAASH